MSKRLAIPMLVALLCSAAVVNAYAGKPRDRDRDGLPDRWEKRYKLSTKHRSAGRDPDRDRLTNRREHRARTHPRRADTDRDGLKDRAEIRRWRTNPRRADTDRDGLKDRAEVRRWRTNPRRADTDRDGLKDRAEIRRWRTNPRRADTDRDGIRDGVEARAGSDPLAANPPPPASAPPAPRPSACPSAAANVPGGKDPWGGCWPGKGTAGLPSGTVLTPYTGPCTITADGTVIDRRAVNCHLTIRAANVRISNSRIAGTVYLDDPNSPHSFVIVDSEVDAGGPLNSGIGNSNFTAVRVEVHGGYRGIWCDSACTVQDSWVHGQATDPSGRAHESALRMGQGSVIRHNTLLCDAPNVPPDAGCSADLTGYGDFAPVRNNVIERNFFMATTGGTCAYGGSSGGKPFSDDAANIAFVENVFQRGRSGKCGYWFPITDFRPSAPGNRWVGNRWDDGAAVPPS